MLTVYPAYVQWRVIQMNMLHSRVKKVKLNFYHELWKRLMIYYRGVALLTFIASPKNSYFVEKKKIETFSFGMKTQVGGEKKTNLFVSSCQRSGAKLEQFSNKLEKIIMAFRCCHTWILSYSPASTVTGFKFMGKKVISNKNIVCKK